MSRYNNLKMSLLDNAKIGNSAQVNLELSKDRLNKEIIDTINLSNVGKISDFRITDGQGIGVVLKLSNGKEQWFFENEIDIFDDNGNIMEKDNDMNQNINLIFSILKDTKYENKTRIRDLLNPINFLVWLIVSIKDVF